MEILDKYIELIEEGYCSDCNELNCIDNFPQEKIVQEIKNLQKKAEHQKQMIKSQYGTIKSINKTSQNRKEAIKSLLVQNEKLKKKAELGDHYKHLYSEVKKQKDDVVEYIKKNKLFKYVYDEEELFEIITDKQAKEDLLRMLGEIDVED